ncbi:P-loop containing nucleoside triphosphate hydrolase protein [Xylariaceae sp. FL1651]|nr:P-loop containing nucleoside triphosphate hydrolase protein [Xylariaceae sp. FL1651]
MIGLLETIYPSRTAVGGKKFRHALDFQSSTIETSTRIKEFYVLFPQRTQGLGLKMKRWAIFEIDNISDSAPKSSLSQLNSELVLMSDDDKLSLRTVLPKGEQAVCITKDIIPDKGEGKVFLLYGPPGTGKTLTVECVANDTRQPLICLTHANIGDTYNSEEKLRKWFTITSKWNAVFLIDEADLFLEQHRDGDSVRNGLATVFLRSKEYYRGVLFLTTNRPGHINDSFISRITFPIAFKPFSTEAKALITNKFVRKFEESGIIEVEKRENTYFLHHCENLNGRQNDMNAQDLDLSVVKMHHVKASVERQYEFRMYLDSIQGGRDESTRARSRQDYQPPA